MYSLRHENFVLERGGHRRLPPLCARTALSAVLHCCEWTDRTSGTRGLARRRKRLDSLMRSSLHVYLAVGLFAVVCGEFAQNLGLAYRFAMVQRNDVFRRVLTGWKFAVVYQLIAGLGAFVHTYFTVGAFSDAKVWHVCK